MIDLQQAKALTERDRDLLQRVKSVVQSFAPDATVFLYGSVARGSQERDSDYDLLVLTTESLPSSVEDRIQDAVYGIELREGVVISLLVFSRDQWYAPRSCVTPFHRSVEQDGILV